VTDRSRVASSRVLRRTLGVVAVAAAALASSLAPAESQGDPPAGAAAEHTVNGEQLFATLCGWCHQSGGRTAGRGPKLAGTAQTDEYIIDRIKRGKEGAMPAFGKAFDDKQIQAIVGYIRSLKDEGQ
jgi:mono/diheme cytochrome c family protein